MSQPVRLGLVFPRSGQQLFIHVPLNIAENSEARRGEFPRFDSGVSALENSNSASAEDDTNTE